MNCDIISKKDVDASMEIGQSLSRLHIIQVVPDTLALTSKDRLIV